MKVTYIEKGPEVNFTRRDVIRTFIALDYFQPEGTSLVYFRLDRYNLKTIAKEDILKIED